MALSDGDNKIRRELRIHERLDDLRADLADYIAEISDASVQARGVFSIAISGGSLIGLLGYLYLIFFHICFYAFRIWCWIKNLLLQTENSWKLLIIR